MNDEEEEFPVKANSEAIKIAINNFEPTTIDILNDLILEYRSNDDSNYSPNRSPVSEAYTTDLSASYINSPLSISSNNTTENAFYDFFINK